jgi:hypothetical protein
MSKKIPDFSSHKPQTKGTGPKATDDAALKSTIKSVPKVASKPQTGSSKSGRRGS